VGDSGDLTDETEARLRCGEVTDAEAGFFGGPIVVLVVECTLGRVVLDAVDLVEDPKEVLGVDLVVEVVSWLVREATEGLFAAVEVEGVMVARRSLVEEVLEGEGLLVDELRVEVLRACPFVVGFLFSSPDTPDETPSRSEGALVDAAGRRVAELAVGRVGGLLKPLPSVERVLEERGLEAVLELFEAGVAVVLLAADALVDAVRGLRGADLVGAVGEAEEDFFTVGLEVASLVGLVEAAVSAGGSTGTGSGATSAMVMLLQPSGAFTRA